MKKRILASVLAMLILLCAAGCQTAEKNLGSEAPPPAAPSSPMPDTAAPPVDTETPPVETKSEDAYALETYMKIADKLSMSSASGQDVQFDMDIIMKTDTEYAGKVRSTELSGNIKMKISGDEMQASVSLNMGELGMVEMYSDGEKAYCSLNGIEIEIDTESVFGQVGESASIPQFEEDAIKSCEITEDGDNIRMLLIISGEALTDFMTESMASMLGEVAQTSEMKIHDIEITLLTTKDEIPVSMDMKMELELTIDEEPLKMLSTTSYIFNEFGSGVSVDLSML